MTHFYKIYSRHLHKKNRRLSPSTKPQKSHRLPWVQVEHATIRAVGHLCWGWWKTVCFDSFFRFGRADRWLYLAGGGRGVGNTNNDYSLTLPVSRSVKMDHALGDASIATEFEIPKKKPKKIKTVIWKNAYDTWWTRFGRNTSRGWGYVDDRRLSGPTDV